MKEVRLKQLHIPRNIRLVLPVVPLALGFAAVAIADQGAAPMQQPAASESLSATPSALSSLGHTTTTMTVNGQPVPVGADGSASVDLPGGSGKVTVSGDGTAVSTTDGTDGGSGGNHNVNVNVNSITPDKTGSSWSSTQVFGSSNNTSRSSRSFSSTNVFSTSSTNSESSQ